MAYKTAQVQGTSSISTYSTLYSTPSDTEAVISTISICNTASTSATYRIAIEDGVFSPGPSTWIVYDSVISAKDTVFLTIGMTLQENKYIRISSSINSLAFSAFVSETG